MTATFPYKVRRALTTDDKLSIGNEMAGAAARREQLGEELKEIKEQYKSRVTAAETVLQRCQRALNNGWQMVEVPCYWSMDCPTYGLKSIIRTDTGEVVQSEAMSNSDRQEVLEFEGEPEQSEEQQQAESEPPAVSDNSSGDAAVESEEPSPDPDDPKCTLSRADGKVLLEMKSSELQALAADLKKKKSRKKAPAKRTVENPLQSQPLDDANSENSATPSGEITE
jgi:hypothetical protein